MSLIGESRGWRGHSFSSQIDPEAAIRVSVELQMVQSCIKSGGRDKSGHPWQQGDADRELALVGKEDGLWQWIEALSKPGELVLDPFAGSGEWGDLIAGMGRKWIGCDLVEGGSTLIAADEIDDKVIAEAAE